MADINQLSTDDRVYLVKGLANHVLAGYWEKLGTNIFNDKEINSMGHTEYVTGWKLISSLVHILICTNQETMRIYTK